MEQKELDEILESHKRWLQSGSGKYADLRGADLTGANLTGANLTEADLRGADSTGADLRWADLIGANLTGANLTGANLTEADLTGADLRGADLYGADLCGADLRRVDLRNADLRRANFANAIGLSVLSVQVNTSWKNRRITYIPSLDVVTVGSFQETFKEFEKRVEKEHKKNPFVLARYRRVIAFLKHEAEEDEKRLEQND